MAAFALLSGWICRPELPDDRARLSFSDVACKDVISEMTIALNIALGVLSGIISGLLVSVICSLAAEVRAYHQRFEADIQAFVRYLERIHLELGYWKDEDAFYHRICYVISDEPFRLSFRNGLNEEGRELVEQIAGLVKDLRALVEKKELKRERCFSIRGKLSKYALELLQKKKDLRNPWLSAVTLGKEKT